MTLEAEPHIERRRASKEDFGEIQLAALFYAKKQSLPNQQDYLVAEKLIADLRADSSLTPQIVLEAWQRNERMVKDSHRHELRIDSHEKE